MATGQTGRLKTDGQVTASANVAAEGLMKRSLNAVMAYQEAGAEPARTTSGAR
jgi:hypothetical protein